MALGDLGKGLATGPNAVRMSVPPALPTRRRIDGKRHNNRSTTRLMTTKLGNNRYAAITGTGKGHGLMNGIRWNTVSQIGGISPQL